MRAMFKRSASLATIWSRTLLLVCCLQAVNVLWTPSLFEQDHNNARRREDAVPADCWENNNDNNLRPAQESQSQQSQKRRAEQQQPIIDFMSIGTLSRPHSHIVQQRTMGSHPLVRNFFLINEDDDVDQSCQFIDNATIWKVSSFCQARNSQLPRHLYPELRKMTHGYASRHWLSKKANPRGWLCAIKRPTYALLKALEAYTNKNQPQELPDYLIKTDDDSWVNIDRFVEHFDRLYPPDKPYVVAGCKVRERIMEHNFTIPFGGWSLIWNKKAVENLLRPVHCPINDDEHNRLSARGNSILSNETRDTESPSDFDLRVCARVAQNLVGEQPLFRNGMNVVQLMEAYVNRYRYGDIDTWGRRSPGFCMHSDWVFGYFMNWYFVGTHAGKLKFPNDRLYGYNDTTLYAGASKNRDRWKECLVDSDEKCTAQNTFCHYISPEHMYKLDKELKAKRGTVSSV